jgi:hypothetical protein
VLLGIITGDEPAVEYSPEVRDQLIGAGILQPSWLPFTGPLAANGKAALLAPQMWSEDVNAKGGLLGRDVNLSAMTTKAARSPSRLGYTLSPSAYRAVVGALLLLAGWRIARSAFQQSGDAGADRQPPLKASVLSGPVIGLIAGITELAAGSC